MSTVVDVQNMISEAKARQQRRTDPQTLEDCLESMTQALATIELSFDETALTPAVRLAFFQAASARWNLAAERAIDLIKQGVR